MINEEKTTPITSERLEWQKYFDHLSHFSPKADFVTGNFSTEFWENLYQTFKARMDYERDN